MTFRPPNQNTPSPPPPQPPPVSRRTRLSRLYESLLPFSLYNKPIKFLSLLHPLFNCFFSKTLGFFSMDSLLFSIDDNNNNNYFDRDLTLRPSSSSSDLDIADERLYFVPFRWWSEARESLIGPFGDVKGVLYEVQPCEASLGTVGFGGYYSKSEIVVNMKRGDKSECAEEGDYALIAEWMFLRTLKWHFDAKGVGGFVAVEENKLDIFPLLIRLLVSRETNSLVVKISKKDNEIAAFSQACHIFCVKSGLLSIWDFSGQTTQFFTHDRIRLSDEIHLELQVYGSSYFMKTRERRKEEIAIEQDMIGGSIHSGLLQMNGNIDNFSSYVRVNKGSSFCSSFHRACSLGLTGLYNLGNTCFMNSAIQCLVHTSKLVDFFLEDYRKDINYENPLGMNGELALQFGNLLRKLWTLGATPVAPRVFKSKLAAFAPQFSGYNQHDSQEFIAFLLDGLHEDLNRVKCKPYIEAKDAEGRPDEEVADEHWRNHLARNNSIIVDVCQGQYRSTLVCPDCKKLSTTFDPFMYLSLPLPSTTMRTMTLTVFSTDGTSLPYPVTVTIPKYGRFKDLVQTLSAICSLREDETLLVAEVYNNCILRFLDQPSDSIELVRDDDLFVAYRMPKASETSPLFVFMHERVETQERSFLPATPQTTMFGVPLVTRISNLSRGSEIHKEFLKLMNPFLMPVEDSSNDDGDDQKGANEDIQMEDSFGAKLSDADGNSNTESGEDSDVGPDFQFYLIEERFLPKGPKIEMNKPVPISVSARIIKVLVSWPDKMTKFYDTCLLSSLPQICKPGLLTKQPQESVSLYRCLEAFLKEEPLGPEDMWYCPNCKKHQQASKKLDLWRLPEILIIHLKRFSYSRFFKNKLETFIDFPIDDFDLSTHVVYENTQVSHRYMLYAISNHYGGLGGGHYTAFVQHGCDRWWYEFDDSRVSPVSEDQIKTSAAYVLFYRRIADI